MFIYVVRLGMCAGIALLSLLAYDVDLLIDISKDHSKLQQLPQRLTEVIQEIYGKLKDGDIQAILDKYSKLLIVPDVKLEGSAVTNTKVSDESSNDDHHDHHVEISSDREIPNYEAMHSEEGKVETKEAKTEVDIQVDGSESIKDFSEHHHSSQSPAPEEVLDESLPNKETIPIEVYEVKYTIDVSTAPGTDLHEEISLSANEFCQNHIHDFKLSIETIAKNCIHPVDEYLHTQIYDKYGWPSQELSGSIVEISVPVETMSGEKRMFVVKFDPEQTTPNDAAKSLCTNQKDVFQVDDNSMQSNCVNPVTDFLRMKLAQELGKDVEAVDIDVKVTKNNPQEDQTDPQTT